MKIIVCTTQDLETKESKNLNFFDNDKFFITIKNSEDSQWAISYNNPQYVLRVSFDKLLTENDAAAIHQFVDSINPKKILYINCNDGRVRSGTVGYVVNEYLNKFLINNKTDYDYFNYVNSNIKLDEDIKTVLTNEFFSDFNLN